MHISRIHPIMKVVISGYGVISAIGNNTEETLRNFKLANIEPTPVSVFDSELKNPVFEVKNFTPSSKYTKQRTTALLFNALQEALSKANLSKSLKTGKVGVCIGTTVACQLNDIDFYRTYKEVHKVKQTPIKRYLNGNLAETIKQSYNLSGPALTVVNACTSGADAIGTAALWIENGLCDIAIAGGADEINKIPLTGFASLSNMSSERCQPFDKNRSGLNIGEGAGIVILESEKSAKKRKHNSNIILSAYSTATDAYHLTAPSPEGIGLRKAILNALDTAGASPKDIAFINAHGTATKDNDLTEGKIFKEIFGSRIKFLSTKGYTGHTLGAAGGIETVFTILGLQNKWIPKNHGFKNFDEEIGLSPITETTSVNKNVAISTSLAFGGNNSVLIFKNKRNPE